MRFRFVAPLILVLALTGCSKASSVTPAASNTTGASTSSTASGVPATGDDLNAIHEVATKFMRAAQIADWTTVCSVSVDKVGAVITGDAVKQCADNYVTKTDSVNRWKKLTKKQQDTITADALTIEYTGNPTITGDTALTDKNWSFKGKAASDGPQLALKRVNGTWWVDTTNTPHSTPSANPSTSPSPIAS
jgi:hypothetical protein